MAGGEVYYLPERSAPLQGSGGGGTLDPMEARVERLEEDVKELKADMKAIRADTAAIRGQLGAMPTTIQLLGFIIAVLALAGFAKFLAP